MGLSRIFHSLSSGATYLGWKYRQSRPPRAITIRMIPITSQIGTNPMFCGIAMDGKDIVGEVVGTKVVTEVCTVPEGWAVLALPAITAATGMIRSETSHNNIRKWLI